MRFDDEFNGNKTPAPDDGFEKEIDIGELEFDEPLTESVELLSLTDETPVPAPKKSQKKPEPDIYAEDNPVPKNDRSKNKKPIIIAICSACAAILLIVIGCLIAFGGNPGSTNTVDDNPLLDVENGITTLKVQDLTLAGVPNDFIIATGVKINDTDVGGKTLSQARRIVSGIEDSLVFDFSYTVKLEDKTEVMKSSDIDYEYNTEKVLATVVDYTKSLGDDAYNEDNPEVSIEITCDVDSKKIDAYITDVAGRFTQEAKDAEITAFHPWEDNKFDYAEGANGLTVEPADLSTDFYKLYNAKTASGTITPKATVVEPEVTVDFLKENIVGLASHWTYSGNTANGNNNMKIALERSNGAVIEPGETYSFAKYSGNTSSAAEGYREAIVYSNGESVMDIGGGACQAATTIYGAAVYANLEVVEREGHRYCSGYTQSGFDATISYGAIDLKLRNKTDFPMFLETKMEGTKLTCNIYGYQDPSFDDIATYSYNYNYYSGQQYSTRAYRIYLKDGVEVDREFLNTTTYSLQNNHYMVSPDPGTIGARPGGEERSVYVTPDPSDGPVYDHNTGGNNNNNTTEEETTAPTEATEAPTQEPTQKPTQAPTEAPTEAPTPAPTDPVTDPTEDVGGSDQGDPSEDTPVTPDPQE